MKVLALLVGFIVIAGVFGVGLMIFRGKIQLTSPSRPSPSFERFFPKVFGGLWMAMAGYGMVLLVWGLFRVL